MLLNRFRSAVAWLTPRTGIALQSNMRTTKLIYMVLLSFTLASVAHANLNTAKHAQPKTHHHVPDVRQAEDLDRALEKFHLGDALKDHALRDEGLDHSVRLLVEMQRHGVKLKFDPLEHRNEQIADHLRHIQRVEKVAAFKTHIVGALRTCFLLAHFVCGYDMQDPAQSTVTEITEVERPSNPYRLKFGYGG